MYTRNYYRIFGKRN